LPEMDAEKTKNKNPNIPRDQSEQHSDESNPEPDKKEQEARPNVDLKSLFNTEPLLDQLEMQVGLLTSAMNENMLLATGAAPDLSEGPMPAVPNYATGYAERPTSWADARSLHMRDAARLSFATASLIGAYSKLKGLAPQRITARYTTVPDPDGRKKPRQITTITDSVIAAPDVSSRATQQA
jgi:hypothetical protein